MVMNKASRLMSVCVIFFILTACQSAYYSALEKVGVYKRDIMVDRVEEAKDAQENAQQQFNSALEQLSQLINFTGGDVEVQYQLINDQYQQSEQAAANVSNRISKIEEVAQALFDEWADEITQYSNAKLKRQSQLKLQQTQRRYQKLITALHNAESKMAPVLAALKDNSLYLKHNLNAQAIGALQGEFKLIKLDVEVLIKEMNIAIEQSQQFIDLL